MPITRIIPEITSTDLPATRSFYRELIGLRVAMDDEPFLALASPEEPAAQLIVNDNGHPGLPPGFAIDVGTADRVTELHDEMSRRGMVIVEPLRDKPWGIRRFSVLDPNGARVTVIAHLETTTR